MKEQLNIFVDTFGQFMGEIATTLPSILGAIVIFVIGWIVAKLIKRIFIKLLKAVRFEVLTEKAGIDKFLENGGVKINAVNVLGTLFYWIIMLIVIMATLNSLNLTAVSALFNEILLYIPNIIVSIVVLILGIYAARLISQIIKTSLTSMQESASDLISRISFVAIIIFTVFLTLGQLSIAESIVTSAFQIIFGAICLALALAFGLGGKEKAAEVLKDLFNNKD